MLLSIGDQVRPGTYRFHSRFNRVVNFQRRGRLLAVVDQMIGPGPLNIVLRSLKHPRAECDAEPAPSILTHPDSWKLGESADDPSPALAGTLSPSDGERDGVRGLTSIPRPAPIQAHGSGVLILKGLHQSAQCWIAPPFPGDATPGIRPRKTPNPERVESHPPFNSPLMVTQSSVWFQGHRYHFTAGHRYDSTLALRSVDLRRFQRNLLALGDSLKEAAPAKSLAFLLNGKRRECFRAGFERAFAEQVTRGVRQVFHGHLLLGIRQLKGCGLGLTPAGDDFIAGYLIGLHVTHKLRGQDSRRTADAVFRAARGKNIFSNTFLDLARRGWLFGRTKDVVLALTSGSEGAVRRASRKLFGVGETSGADLATGLFLTLHSAL